MMIQCLWYQQDDAIIDVKLRNADSDSYKYKEMTALLGWGDTIQKNKQGKQCHDKRKIFSLCYFC